MSTATIELEVLLDLHRRVEATPYGQRSPLYESTASTLGCSVQTVHRKLKQADLSQPLKSTSLTAPPRARKRRSDAGTSELESAELELLSGVIMTSANKKGQRLPVGTALDMLVASGTIKKRVSASTASRLLYQRRLHPNQLMLPTASVRVGCGDGPNVMAQSDSTTGAYYYMPGGHLGFMAEDEFYKNKPANLIKAGPDLLTRYAYVDAASHCFKARYYLGGETAENLLDFLTWAMWKQDCGPMHGVPEMLMMDPGAANKGQVIRNFCKNVGVQLIHHAPGSARVTGSVEKVHDLINMHFEKRLPFVKPATVTLDSLNGLLEDWTVNFCSTRVHSRHGKTRYDAWSAITPERLRAPASLEALRAAAVRNPETRGVSNTRTVSFNGKTYDVSKVPGVVAGLKITMQVNVFRHPSIDVQVVDPDTGEESWHTVDPQVVDEWGYPVGAHVWGETPRVAANSEVDETRNRQVREAYRTVDGLPTLKEAAKARKQHAQAYAGVVDAMADVHATPVVSFLPRAATPLPLPTRTVQARRMSVVEACKALKSRLGAAYSPQIFAVLSQEYADDGSVPEDALNELQARFAAPAADDGQPLQAVQGQ